MIEIYENNLSTGAGGGSAVLNLTLLLIKLK